MKTAPTSPWIRFEEAIAFGGAETELVDRLRKIEPSYLHYDPELRVDHHVSLSWIGFLRKAYMQGRSAAILSGESSKAPMPPRTGSRGLYGLSFDTGRLIGWTYGRNRAPRSFILKALAFQFFGWPKLRVVTSEGRIHEPIVARQFAPVLSFLFTFFNQVKVSVFWRTFYPSFCRTWGLLQRFWASAAQFVFWDHIFPVWIFAKKRIFWDKMFPIWIFAKKRMFWDTIFPLWVITKKMVYWNGVFRIYVFFKSRAWRLKWAYWQVSALAGRTILKPYFFARYQFQKRIVKKEALR